MVISLALGGGGARGFAHIGILRQLTNSGIKVGAIAGTSAGGIVACLFAAGFSPEKILKIALEVNQNRLYSLPSNEGPALLSLSNVTKILENILGDLTFAKLKIPCAVVAVDLELNQELTLYQGRVVDAILATIAVPGIFPPKEIDGRFLVDGGILNPVPVSAVRKLRPELPVVAAVLSPQMNKPNNSTNIRLPIKVPSGIIKRITHLRVTQAFTIFMKSVDLGARLITELRLEFDNPDIVIRPEVADIGLFDMVDIMRVEKLGELAAKSVNSKIKKSFSWTNRIKRRLIQRRYKNITMQ